MEPYPDVLTKQMVLNEDHELSQATRSSQTLEEDVGACTMFVAVSVIDVGRGGGRKGGKGILDGR